MAAVHLFEPQFQRWVSQARSSSAGPGAPGGPSGPIRGSDPRPLPVTEDRQGGIPPLGFASIGLDFSKQCRFGARASCKVSPWITRACGEKNRVQARGPTFSGQPWRSSEAQCGPDLGYRSISRLVFFFPNSANSDFARIAEACYPNPNRLDHNGNNYVSPT